MSDNLDSFDIELPNEGVNPKVFFDKKDWITKGQISKNQAIAIAGGLAMNEVDMEDGNFEDMLYQNFMRLSLSVNGFGIIEYGKTANNRINAEDRKTSIKIDGGSK